MRPSTKKLAVNILKLVIVVALLWGMVRDGKLSLSQMSIFLERAELVWASVLVWLVGPVILGSLRWWLLIRGGGLHCSYLRALRLQLVGFFFNTAMPGSVGGDIVKAIYIVRDQDAPSGKTPALLSVLLDRIIGLIGLFLMGVIAALFSYDQLMTSPVTRNLVFGLGFVVALSFLFLAVVFIPWQGDADPLRKILSIRIPGLRLLKRVYDALRIYKDRPILVFSSILISVVIQLVFFGFMAFIGRLLYGSEAFDVSLLAPVFPFGILITAIPLAPGGLGVGHTAFDKLFQVVGLPGGANVFNLYVLSQLALNLLGLIPYLSMKSQTKSSRVLDEITLDEAKQP